MEGINRIKEYFVSMEMYNGRWVVCVKFRPKWGAYSSDDGRIKVGPDEKQADVWWYCANDDDVEVDEIIDLIDETVQTNMEAIKKVELFKLKASELKQIFSDENTSFKKLQSLKFVFDEDVIGAVDTKAKKSVRQDVKKAAPTKKDLISQVGEEIQEHNILSAPVKQEEEATESDRAKTYKRKTSGKSKVTESMKSVTPVDMTQEEIDSLRG